jgi:hypothetical protein
MSFVAARPTWRAAGVIYLDGYRPRPGGITSPLSADSFARYSNVERPEVVTGKPLDTSNPARDRMPP